MKNFFIKKNIKACPAKPACPVGRLQRSGGFTLVETLVALAIFSASIVGMLVILAGGISSTTFIKGKVIATYLSQEGIELTRNLRDSYILDATGWTAFAGACPGVCQIENDNSSGGIFLTPCPTSSSQKYGCPVLNYNSGTGFYDYSGGQNSIPSAFTRVIVVAPRGSSGDELNVRSIVYWDYQGQTHRVESSENLFNWQ